MTGSVPAAAQPSAGRPEHRYGLAAELGDRFRLLYALDRASLAKLRVPPWLVYAVGVILAAVFGLVRVPFFHAEEIPGHALVSYVFTDSIVFLVVAFVVGLLSRLGGLLFVVTFSMSDLIAWLLATNNYDPGPHLFSTIATGQAPSLATFVGHVSSYVLLGVLVVAIPGLCRGLEADLRGLRFGRLIAPVGIGMTAGVGALAWLTAAPYLIRPIFGDYFPAQEIDKIQANDVVIAALFGLIAGAGAFVLGPGSAPRIVPFALLPWRRWLRRLGPIVGPVIVYVGLFIFISGVVTSLVDVAILIVAAIFAELGATILPRFISVSALIRRLPFTSRLLLMALVGSVIALLVTSFVPEASGDSKFLPLVLELAVAIVVFRWLFTTESASVTAAATGVAAVLLLFAVSMAITWLAAPSAAFADNCGDWTDCKAGHNVFSAALFWLALVGLPFAMDFLWSWIKGVHVPDPVGVLEPALSPEGAAAAGGTLDALKNKAAMSALAAGDDAEYSRIKNESMGEFAQEAAAGKYR